MVPFSLRKASPMSDPIPSGTVLNGILQSRDAKELAKGDSKPGTLTYVGAVSDDGTLDFDLSRAMFMFAGQVVRIHIEAMGTVEEFRTRPTDPPPAPVVEPEPLGATCGDICGHHASLGEFCEKPLGHVGEHGRGSRVPAGPMTGKARGADDAEEDTLP